MSTPQPPGCDTPLTRRRAIQVLASAPLVPAIAGTDAGPTILPMGQPRPAVTRVCHLRIGGQIATAIVRQWADGAERRCRLCTSCWAQQGACLVMIGCRISHEEAPLFDSRPFPIQDPSEHRPGTGGGTS
jgi:hypothetical protein